MSKNSENKLDQILESLNKLSDRIDKIEGKLDLLCESAADTHRTPNSSRGSTSKPQQEEFMRPSTDVAKTKRNSEAENIFAPRWMVKKRVESRATEEEETQKLLKTVRSIMNKITPQRFTPLMMKLKLLPIDTEQRLREVVNIIFEKAVNEHSSCECYANVCRVMFTHKVATTFPSSQGDANHTSVVVFGKALLARCQEEFEKGEPNEDKFKNFRKKIEEAKTPKEKQQLKKDLSNAEKKERHRMLGNIRFIGELFKLNMLSEPIMHNCFLSLFRARNDASLESICCLLTTIGMGLDHLKGKHLMDQYFLQIEKIIEGQKTSSRLLRLLKDVTDLRLNNWVPRDTKAQNPKEIDQVHQDAKNEKEQQAAIDASAPKNQFDESNVTLRPSQGKLEWKSGSGASTTSSTADALTEDISHSLTTTTMNRFSALGETKNHEYSRTESEKKNSYQEQTRSHFCGSSGSSREAERDKEKLALDAISKQTSIERNHNYSGELTQKAVSNLPDVRVDETAILKRAKSIIEEYLHLLDIKKAAERFDELNLPPAHQHLIVRSILKTSLGKTSTDRAHVGKLFSSLVRDGKILPAQYLKGVTSNMELAINLELDLPRVWSYVAEQISSIFYESGGKIQLHSLKDITSPLLQANKAHLLTAEVLKLLIKYMNVETVVQYWLTSNMPMGFFLKTSNPKEVLEYFTKQGLLEFYNLCQRAGYPLVSQISNTDFEDYKVNIIQQLELYKENEPVLHWIDENISPDDKLESSFIRALTTAVCNNAIVQGQQNIELNKSVLTDRSMLLKRYINDDAMELTALYALQRLYVNLEQPPNLLKMIFNVLYDEDVISEQTFFKWKEEDNPEESEGKGVAILSATSFFTWLLKAEEESDE